MATAVITKVMRVRMKPMKSIRLVAWIGVVVTYFLIALGGTVLAP